MSNPVDMLGSATEATHEQVLPRMLADPGIDAVIVLFVPPVVASAQDVADAVARAAAGAEKPVLTSLISGAAMTLPPGVTNSRIRSPPVEPWESRQRGRNGCAAPPVRLVLEGIDPDAARSVVAAALEGREEAWLDPAGTRAVLEAYGIPVVPSWWSGQQPRLRRSARAGAARSRQERGSGRTQDRDGWGRRRSRVGGGGSRGSGANRPIRRPGPAAHQRQCRASRGCVQDPVFGPLVASSGRRLVELIGQAAFRIAPLTDVDVNELVTGGKAGELVGGFRGKEAPIQARSRISSTGCPCSATI